MGRRGEAARSAAAKRISCGPVSEQAQTVITLAPAEVAKLAEAGEVVLVDVRKPYEYEAGRLRGSRHIEMNDLQSQAESLPRERKLVFYCRSGDRAEMAAEAFRLAGYDAYAMEGGITAWAEEGLPLEPEGGEVAPPRPV
jgi:rhodanese-related sulfurtransferase